MSYNNEELSMNRKKKLYCQKEGIKYKYDSEDIYSYDACYDAQLEFGRVSEFDDIFIINVFEKEKISLHSLKNKVIIERIAIEKPEFLCYLTSLGIHYKDHKTVLKFYEANLGLTFIGIINDRLGGRIIQTRKGTSPGKATFYVHEATINNFILTNLGNSIFSDFLNIYIKTKDIEKGGLIDRLNVIKYDEVNISQILMNFKIQYNYENFRNVFWDFFTFEQKMDDNLKSSLNETLKDNPLIEFPKNNSFIQKSGNHIEISYKSNLELKVKIYCNKCKNFTEEYFFLENIISNYYLLPKNRIINCNNCNMPFYFSVEFFTFSLEPIEQLNSYFEYQFNKLCKETKIQFGIRGSKLVDPKNKGNYIIIDYHLDKQNFYPDLTIFCNDCKSETRYRIHRFLGSSEERSIECSTPQCKKLFYIEYDLQNFRYVSHQHLIKKVEDIRYKSMSSIINKEKQIFQLPKIHEASILRALNEGKKGPKGILNYLIKEKHKNLMVYLSKASKSPNYEKLKERIRLHILEKLNRLIREGLIQIYKDYTEKSKRKRKKYGSSFVKYYELTEKGKTYFKRFKFD